MARQKWDADHSPMPVLASGVRFVANTVPNGVSMPTPPA
jgi:hypothetical protein